MSLYQSSILSRSLAVILGVVFLLIIAMGVISYIKPNRTVHRQTETLKYPINKVWVALFNRNYYLQSRKDISKFHIIDSLYPSWVENFTYSDSVINITKDFTYKKRFVYTIINNRYEQANGVAIKLDSLSPSETRVEIAEKSIYNNTWARMYFQVFHPNTVLDYEFLKLRNTLSYMDSVNIK